MKVGIWLDEHINEELGGGFSYTDKLIKLIDDYSFSDKLKIVFISCKQSIKSYNKELVYLNYPINEDKKSIKEFNIIGFKRIINKLKLNQSLEKIYPSAEKINSYYKDQLKKKGVNVIYYPIQNQCFIEGFPFISTNWDIGHLSMFAFPETNSNDFEIREKWYRNTLLKALAIFTESNSGKEELVNYLNINPNRIKVLPIFPGAVTNQNVTIEQQNYFLKKYDLKKDIFFFYPAQYWAHKNHINLILAFKKVLKIHPDIKLVFTGSDKGNLRYIKKVTEVNKLSKNILFLGFLDLEDIFTLYKNTKALVFPSFLGPTNMPLLEARDLECPVLCSDFKGHKEQLGNGALYFNPLEYEDIYKCMLKIMDVNFRNILLEKAKENSINSKFKDSNIMEIFEANLEQVSKYRNCWGN